MSVPKLNLYDFTRDDLKGLIVQWGFSPVHAARLWRYIYHELVVSLEGLEALPRALRAVLESRVTLEVPAVCTSTDSSDGFTRKYLLGLADGERIETVRMYFSGRVTACVSSQVGCAMGCVFCATGQQGYTRHLTAGEIVAQVVHVARGLKFPAAGEVVPASATPVPRLRNVVLMGMGEPLHNYEMVMRALAILCDETGLSLGAGRITLSTVGVVPGILRLAAEEQPCHLAVSLHAATQSARAELVPAARKWPLDELMSACRVYSERTGRRIFYEWTLIAGKNDSVADARAVGELLRGLPAQVNLIPLNPTIGYEGTPGAGTTAREFQDVLAREFSIPSTVRQRRGIDIAAGCGQLAIAG